MATSSVRLVTIAFVVDLGAWVVSSGWLQNIGSWLQQPVGASGSGGASPAPTGGAPQPIAGAQNPNDVQPPAPGSTGATPLQFVSWAESGLPYEQWAAIYGNMQPTRR